MPWSDVKRALLVTAFSCATIFPRLDCLRLHRRSVGKYVTRAHRAVVREANSSENVSSFVFDGEHPGIEYLSTDHTIWKHSNNIDVRKMLFADAGGAAAALKITRVPSSGNGSIPEPSGFAGDRTLHEIAMFRYLEEHVASAQEHLVLFHGGGEVQLEYEDGQVVGLEFWSDGDIVYKSKCASDTGGDDVYGYSQAHCKDFQVWQKEKDQMLWLLTEYNPRSITLLDYLIQLLGVESVEGFSEGQLRERRMKEVANAIQACQTMMKKLYAESGFVHADYHLKNMLVALPRDSLLSDAAAPVDTEPSLPSALLFDLDFSGFVDAATTGKGHVQSTLVEGALVMNIPMLHALPVLDLSTEASDNLRELLDRQGLISRRAMRENPDAATGVLLHKSDMWLGMMQLHEFSTGCDETPLARQLAGLPESDAPKRQRDAADAQNFIFHNLVKPNWRARGDTEATLEKLYRLDQEFESRKADLGEAPQRHWDEFKNAWFRVKMLVKGFAVEQWRLGE